MTRRPVVGRHLLRAAVFVLAWRAIPACAPAPRLAPILLFTGTGTSQGDVSALRSLLTDRQFDYATTSDSELNRMTEAELRHYRLLIVPGGDFIEIGVHLDAHAASTVRNAVKHGLNYLGICAGAFLAGDSRIAGYHALNLTSGARFGFYAIERRGVRKAAVAISRPGAPTLDQYWEDGPQLTGWGAPVATYPDGTPAVAEGAFGAGWVVLAGVHPEAPASWRRGLVFTTPVDTDNAFAVTLVAAALNRASLASTASPPPAR